MLFFLPPCSVFPASVECFLVFLVFLTIPNTRAKPLQYKRSRHCSVFSVLVSDPCKPLHSAYYELFIMNCSLFIIKNGTPLLFGIPSLCCPFQLPLPRPHDSGLILRQRSRGGSPRRRLLFRRRPARRQTRGLRSRRRLCCQSGSPRAAGSASGPHSF